MKRSLIYKPLGRPNGLRILAVASVVVPMLLSSPIARAFSWYDEIGPHFSPNVPSAATGSVDYTYEFFAFSHGRAPFPLFAHVAGRTWEYGTRNGTPVTWHGVGEHSQVGQYSDICTLGVKTCYAYQSVDWMTTPTTYNPSSGEVTCSDGQPFTDYTNGFFYNQNSEHLDNHLATEQCIVLTSTNSAAPDGSWTITYTYPVQTPMCYYFESALHPACDPPLHATVWGWSAYYRIDVHLDIGASLPPGTIPPLPGPGPGGSCSSKPLVTVVNSFGILRNNWNGSVGFQFQVGSAPLVVTELGRWVVSGNSGTHTVQLFNSVGTPLPGGSVTVNTAGQIAGEFAYAPLNTPLTLAANTTYAVMSQEVGGGDQWYDYGNTQITLSPVASGAFAVWAPPYTGAVGGSGRSYGPVNLRFCE